MDQKRLFLAIAASLAILLGFQLLIAPHVAKQTPGRQQVATVEHPVTTPREGGPGTTSREGAPGTTSPSPAAVPRIVPRVKIDAPQVQGSISLLGARLDDLVLKDYREAI